MSTPKFEPWRPNGFHLSPAEARNILRSAGVSIDNLTLEELGKRVKRAHSMANTIIRMMIYNAKRDNHDN